LWLSAQEFDSTVAPEGRVHETGTLFNPLF
jgi:hypothetical protein